MVLVGEFSGVKREGASFEWVVAWSGSMEDCGVKESKMKASDMADFQRANSCLHHFDVID